MKRYVCLVDIAGAEEFYEHPEGEWVKYEDAAREGLDVQEYLRMQLAVIAADELRQRDQARIAGLEAELAKKDVDRWLTLHSNWQRAEDGLKQVTQLLDNANAHCRVLDNVKARQASRIEQLDAANTELGGDVQRLLADKAALMSDLDRLRERVTALQLRVNELEDELPCVSSRGLTDEELAAQDIESLREEYQALRSLVRGEVLRGQ